MSSVLSCIYSIIIFVRRGTFGHHIPAKKRKMSGAFVISFSWTCSEENGEEMKRERKRERERRGKKRRMKAERTTEMVHKIAR